MPLDTSTKRRSSVGILQPWQTAPPSPTDSPGTVDEADRAHGTFSYSGELADVVVTEGLHYDWRAAVNIWHRSYTLAI